MSLPSSHNLERDEFERYARELFSIDQEALDALYPMVVSLRLLAAKVSELALDLENIRLSETATGE